MKLPGIRDMRYSTFSPVCAYIYIHIGYIGAYTCKYMCSVYRNNKYICLYLYIVVMDKWITFLNNAFQGLDLVETE